MEETPTAGDDEEDTPVGVVPDEDLDGEDEPGEKTEEI